MKNPICLVKNGMALPIEKLGLVERPFAFRIAEKRIGFPTEFQVATNEQPIYFVRKRMKMHGGKPVAHYIHRYCVGVLRSDGSTERHWIMPNGDYDCLNTEPYRPPIN